MKISREIKTALLALAGIALFIFGFSYLKANPIFQSARTFYAIYSHVGGLTTGTVVTINGFPVGKIQDIRFMDSSGKLLVTFNVEDDFQFSKNSKAEIYEAGVIGGKALAIMPAFDNAETAKSGDTLTTSYRPGLTESVENKLQPFLKDLDKLLVSTNSVVGKVDSVFDAKAQADLKRSLSGLSQVIDNFKKTSRSIDGIVAGNKERLDKTIANAENITSNLSKVSDTLAQANLGKTVKDLQATVNNMNGILAKIESGDGSVGKLLKDEALYDNLSGASKQLEQLLQDMKLNPKRYVHFSLFGKRPKQYDPPKETPETSVEENSKN
ncbi:MlaD family protein [Sungkyunkwania multivorans]|uniref:MlaD family protein n=1 Tax=Sungkyunkwania multivorans TaxID=1173618 RepID=A0ABW3CXK2_9FLAO